MSDMFAMIKMMEKKPMLVAEIGDCPNIESPTSGGKLFWQDKKNIGGWRLQHNIWTGNARIIDENDMRKAWGSVSVMEEKFKRLTRKEFLEPGDIVGVGRKKALNLYEHYAVYIGNEMVVHYSGEGTDFSGGISVRKDTLQAFLKGDKNYFVLFFDKNSSDPHKIQVRTSFNMKDIENNACIKLKRNRDFKIYSPEETVKRAMSRIGESNYNLVLNNCEHFAIWCKTGVSASYQVNRIVSALIEAGDFKLGC